MKMNFFLISFLSLSIVWPARYNTVQSETVQSETVQSETVLYQPSNTQEGVKRSQKIPAIVMLLMFITVVLVSETRK